MIPWLRAGHFLGLILWGGGLLALTALLRARERAGEGAQGTTGPLALRLYRRVTGPGAFLALFTGVGLLHLQQPLLKQPWLHAKLTLVAALFVVDHLTLRAIKRPGARVVTVAHALTWIALIGAVALVELRPWAR